MPQTAAVVGVGPGLGESVARRFHAEGCNVALFARSADYLTDLAADLGDGALAVECDVTDPDAVEAGFERVREQFGPVDALVSTVYSTETTSGGLADTTAEAFAGAWAVEVAGAFQCAKAVADDVADREGTMLFTTSALAREASGDNLARSSARRALAGLTDALADDLGDSGVHVARVVVDGWIAKPALREQFPDRPDDEWLDPDEMAATYWHLAEQDGAARTTELDLTTG